MASTINFHIHTTHSDGGNTTAEVVAMLKTAGVAAFAITDHDKVDGNIDAAVFAKEYGLTHINGVELSCCFADGEIGLNESWVVHILGFGINLELMRGKLEELEQKRHERLLELCSLLVADGYDIDFKQITQKGRIPDRKSISKELIRKGYAANDDECYAKILNIERYRPFARNKPTIKEGIDIIHTCGGLAVWAHPFGLTRGGKKDLNQSQVSELLKNMLVYGIDGMEVYYQNFTPEQISWLNSFANRYELYKTVGTDYHGLPVDLAVPPAYSELHRQDKIIFDIVAPDTGVLATLHKLTHMDNDEISYPDKNAYTYKTYHFKCKKCNWDGLGAETIDLTDVINFLGANCPECRELIEFIQFPSSRDVLRYGTLKDKRKYRKYMVEDERRTAKRGRFVTPPIRLQF